MRILLALATAATSCSLVLQNSRITAVFDALDQPHASLRPAAT